LLITAEVPFANKHFFIPFLLMQIETEIRESLLKPIDLER
jgi:hypothetical protein